MQTLPTQKIRPRRVAIAIGVSLFILGLISGPLNHQIMVWVNGGRWCAVVQPEGDIEFLYGEKECDR
jgi:hypothetical protein